MDTIWKDLRYALRSLRNNRSFAAVAILTIALGIGANTAIFSIINEAMLRPLPYPEPQQLVRVRGGSSFPDIQELNARSKSFEKVAGYRGHFFDMKGSDGAERIPGCVVSGDFFGLLKVNAAIGRTIQPADDVPNGAKIVVLSSHLWRTRLASDPNIVGKPLSVGGSTYTVVGVLPAGFALPQLNAELYAPLRVQAPDEAAARGAHSLGALARLKGSAPLSLAQAEVDEIAKSLAKLYPEENTDRRYVLVRWQEYLIRDIKLSLMILLGAVALVLLIAMTNVAGLLMSRSVSRRKEIAIRLALGASRSRLVTQLLVESLLLAAIGGTFGFLLAFWLSDMIVAFAPQQIAQIPSVHLDLRVLLFTGGVSVLSGLLFGLMPALQASHQDLQSTLKEQRSTEHPARNSFRNILVIAEMSIALVLLIGAGLLIRSFYRLQSVDPGFQTKNLLTMNFTLPLEPYGDIQRRTQFFEQVLERIRNLPGVEAVGATSELPFGTGFVDHNFVIEGRPLQTPGTEPEIFNRSISTDYFHTMSIRLRSGRAFTLQDRKSSIPVAIINESAARQYFHGQNPIGQRIRWAQEEEVGWITIVGVAGDIHSVGLDVSEEPAVYTPFMQEIRFWKTWMNVAVRSSIDPASLSAAIRREVARVDPNIPAAEFQTMDELTANSVADRRFSLLLLVSFATLALVLASLGVYGVLSFLVGRRTHEIGIRMALGAERRDILNWMLRHAVRLIVTGICLGIVLSLVSARLIKTLLFGIAPTDAFTLICVSVILSAVALLAGYVPARRAMRVDPMTALRYE